MKTIDWAKYPIRVCRWMNECLICKEKITDGQRYRDGGYGRRAHVTCSDAVIRLCCSRCGEVLRGESIDGMCGDCASEKGKFR